MKTVPSFCPQVIAAAAVACTAWCAGAPSAGACSRIAISYSLAASAVPVTGSIVIDAQCIEEYCESVQPELLVTLDGQAVAGSAQLLRTRSTLFLSWTAAAPLNLGKTYELQLAGDARGELIASERAVVAVDDARWAAPDLAAIQSTLGVVAEPTGESFCCPDLVCGPSCFTEQEIPRAVIELQSETRPRPAFPGFVHRLRWQNAAGQEVGTDWDRLEHRTHAVFDRTSDRYCARLEQRNLSDGSIQSRELCHDSDPDAGYGAARPSAYDPHVLSFGNCPVPPGSRRNCDPAERDCGAPPDRLLEAWCDAVAPMCPTSATIGTAVETCEAREAYCDAPTEQENETATAGQDETDAPSPSAARTRTEGCQLSGAATHGTGWLLGLGLLLLTRPRRLRSGAAR